MSIPESPDPEILESVQQDENQSNIATDVLNHANPIDLTELVVEIGKGTLDFIASALDNIDISF